MLDKFIPLKQKVLLLINEEMELLFLKQESPVFLYAMNNVLKFKASAKGVFDVIVKGWFEHDGGDKLQH